MQIGPVQAWLIPELMCYYMRYLTKEVSELTC